MQNSPNDFNAEAGKIIAAIKAGKKGVIEALYDEFRAEFLNWARRRFYTSQGYLEDAWQESVIIFYEQVKSGRVSELKCSVKTFLFAIGRNKLKKKEGYEKRFVWKDNFDKEIEQVEIRFEDPWEDEKPILLAAIKKLSQKCQDMLTKRYYNDLTIEELSEEYEITKNNVSSVLSQCQKKLEEIIKAS